MNATEKSPRRPAARPRALIATREPALRAGIRLALEPQVECTEAGSTAEALDLLGHTHTDVCFVDADAAAARTTELISKSHPSAAVVLLAHRLDEEQFLQAVRSGAVGYLSESVAPGRLPEVVDSVLRGEAVVPRALVRRLCDELRTMGRRRIQVGGR